MRLRLLALSLLPLLLHAEFDLRRPRFRKPLRFPADAQLARIPLDRETLAAARADLADLRVAVNGEEQPYVLETAAARSDVRAVPSTLADRVLLPGGGVQAILDVSAPGLHNRIQIETPKRNFSARVRIESSDDRVHWAVARADAAIFDFTTSDRHAASLSVTYPDSTRRHLRIAISGWKEPESLAGAAVEVYRERSASYTLLAEFTPRGEPEIESKALLYVLDLGEENLPVERIEFEFGSGLFQRAVDVESSADGKTWHSLARSVVARLPGEERTAVGFAASRQHFLRTRLYHGDDRPVEVRQIRALCVERSLLVRPLPGDAWLYYGDTTAAPAQYDLVAVLAGTTSNAVRASLDRQQANPAYAPLPDSRPWTERHPVVLYSTLAVAVVALGLITMRFLRESRAA